MESFAFLVSVSFFSMYQNRSFVMITKGRIFAARTIFASLAHLKTGEEINFKSEHNVRVFWFLFLFFVLLIASQAYNIAAALNYYLMHSDPVVLNEEYGPIFQVVRTTSDNPLEMARALGEIIAGFPETR